MQERMTGRVSLGSGSSTMGLRSQRVISMDVIGRMAETTFKAEFDILVHGFIVAKPRHLGSSQTRNAMTAASKHNSTTLSKPPKVCLTVVERT